MLVYEVKEGWGPLCRFLAVPVPEGSFPRVNDAKEFQRRTMAATAICWLVILLPLAAIAGLLRWLL